MQDDKEYSSADAKQCEKFQTVGGAVAARIRMYYAGIYMSNVEPYHSSQKLMRLSG